MDNWLRILCLSVAISTWVGCGPRPRARVPDGRSVEHALMEMFPPPRGFAFRAALDKSTYTMQDPMTLEVALSNQGDAPVWVARRMDPRYHLVLHFSDAAGRPVRSQEIRITPKRLSDALDFARLDPGYLYGVRLRLVPKRDGLLGPRYYSLTSPEGIDVDQRFFLPGPGSYSLVASYGTGDNGRAAGVKAWVGAVESTKVLFTIAG